MTRPMSRPIRPASTTPQKMWFATKLITTGIVYNTKAALKPTSWADLTKPEVKNLLAMPSPLNSGAALIHTMTLTGNLPGGWRYYEQLKDNGALAAGGNGDILRQVATGEKLYGMIVDFMPIREKAKGAPVEFVFPERRRLRRQRAGRDPEERPRTRKPRRPSSTS
jgi:iron(III) transport system substrate-binding protein